MTTDLIMIFLLGFTSGFGHCVGMCGGIVLTYSVNLTNNDPSSSGRFSRIWPHVLYNGGRMITYMFLGGIFALAGSTFMFASTAFNYQSVLQIFAGVVMVYMAFDLLNWIPKILPKWSTDENPFRRLTHNLLRQVDRSNIFILGVVLGFLPCGVVYAAGVKAASTGNIALGMLTMMTFALGTFPAMMLMGISAQWITGKFKRRVFKFSAIMVLILGILTIQKGVMKFNRTVQMNDGKNAIPECCEPGGLHNQSTHSDTLSGPRNP